MTGVPLMSEFDSVSVPERSASVSGQSDLQSTPADVSPGALLRQAREAAGLHIAALAVALKVPVKKLEALEADRFELLPDAVFVRALAASVCRSLKIDAAPILQRLPKKGNSKPAYQGIGINTPFRAPGDGPRPSMWTHISRPAVLAGLLLLLGALVLILLPAVKSGIHEVTSDALGSTAPAESVAVPVTAAAGEAVNAAAVKLSSSLAQVPASPSASAANTALLSGGSAIAVPSVSTATQAAATLPSAAPASASPASILTSPAAAASAALQGPSSGIVVFRAKGDSWVEVTDSKGIVVLRRTLVTGEVAGASGVLPLVAVVGRADATEVKIRGKVFDLAAFAKDNVARFEVK